MCTSCFVLSRRFIQDNVEKRGTRATRTSGRNNLLTDPVASSLSVLFILTIGDESFRETRQLDLNGLVLSHEHSLYYAVETDFDHPFARDALFSI